MKSFLLLIGLVLLLSSCIHVYFIEPQPQGAERLTEVPEILHGKWFDKHQGWQHYANGFAMININRDSLGTVVDTTYHAFPLGDTIRIYKAKELYIIHFKNNSEYWEIITLHCMKNGDIHSSHMTNPDLFAIDKGLKLEYAYFYIDGEEKRVTTLHPEHEESLQFESAVFSGQMKVKTLRNAMAQDNYTILTTDGRMLKARVPEEELNGEEEE